ncbi:MAG: hypothetical protein JO323_04570 [Acidobacteriia bacterium]|nr:hypothetical protein [Terriglobia bacterium]
MHLRIIPITTLPIAAAIFCSTLAAQWPAHPTPDVPRKPDGKPNLEAPTPRTADGKPDLSGIWENLRRNAGGQAAGAQAAGQAAGGTPLATFRDVGSGLKDGLPLQPWAAELKKQRMAQNSKDNPDARCLPMGLMQFHMHPQPRKIIQTPGLVLILYEANDGIRQIFTDGRPLPRDPEPWWYGYSVGHWEGDTLVVETTGLRDGGWLDINGSPQTDAAKFTERFRRVNFGSLEVEITIDDPKAYTKPFTVKVTQRLTPDTDLIEFICQENDDSPKHMVGK